VPRARYREIEVAAHALVLTDPEREAAKVIFFPDTDRPAGGP
jgi:hypothetical protein